MTQISIRNDRWHSRAAAVIGLGGALLLAACATTPTEPTAAIKGAEQAIAAADRARIPDAQSPELNEARVKLTEARTAVQGRQMVVAERLAQESRVDAELASANQELTKAQAVNAEMKRSTDTLSQEMQRNSGATP